MNTKERFLETMKFGKYDRVPYLEWVGFWDDTITRWRSEGMPKYESEIYLGLEHYSRLPFGILSDINPFVPVFNDQLLRDDDKTEVRRASDGAIYRKFKSGLQTMPQWLSYPVENREDFEELKKRMDPYTADRYPVNLKGFMELHVNRDYPAGLRVGSLFGWIRNLMGLENMSYAIFDDILLIDDMMEYITYFVICILEKLLKEIGSVDFAIFWEDMAGKNGSLISPKYFWEMAVPRYKKITSILKKHNINIILLDSDGKIDELIEPWLEGGITGVYPLEVSAGMDPVILRKRYGKKLMLIGGIDKRELAKGFDNIDREVVPKMEFLVDSGGWIPSIDHLVPPDVSLQNYRYYLSLVRKYANRKNVGGC